MAKLDEISGFISSKKEEIKSRYKVKEIGIFGSYARNDQNEKSDLDILVDFYEGGETFDNYMDLKILLEDSLNLKVDLVVKNSLRYEIKSFILSEVIYA
jgi:hypothetical protein